MTLLHILVDSLAVLPSFDIPELDAEFDTGPARAGQQLGNQIMGLCVIGLTVACMVAGVLLAWANLSSRHKTTAWIVLASCGLSAMFLGSIVGFLTFFKNIPLF